MTYSTGPYSKYSSLPVPSRPKINSARSISPQHKRYEINQTTGGFESMGYVKQRILLLVSLNVPEKKFNTPNEHFEIQDAIRKAIQPVIDDREILLLKIYVGSDNLGTQRREIFYKDLTLGEKDDSVQV